MKSMAGVCTFVSLLWECIITAKSEDDVKKVEEYVTRTIFSTATQEGQCGMIFEKVLDVNKKSRLVSRTIMCEELVRHIMDEWKPLLLERIRGAENSPDFSFDYELVKVSKSDIYP